MNHIEQISIHAQTQGRNAEASQHQPSLASLNHRSLRSGLRQPRLERSAFASLRLCVKWLFVFVTFLMATLITSGSAAGQEAAETIRIKTRVVFLDALVKDKKSGIPVSDLALENFQVFDDGKPRTISYFTREGQARKPLALILILDLRDDGAGRFLKRPEILKSMADELAKLPPEDEVAILAINIDSAQAIGSVIRDGRATWLTDFTKNHEQLTAALDKVPSLIDIDDDNDDKVKTEAENKSEPPPENKGGVTVSVDTEKKVSSQAENPNEVVQTETIKGKNGAVITRTTMKDGSIRVKRTSPSGHVVVDIGDIYDLPAAVRDASEYAQKQRANSQASIVWVSDGIVPVFFEDRDATEQLLIRDNVIFSSLTVDLRTLFKFLLPIAKPIGNWMGMSLYGSAKRMAQQTGGEAVRVSRAKDYGVGLSKIVGNLTARYSLGFALAQDEKDDGRLHSLDVRVQAQDQKGKTRKLNVSARKGYYMTTGEKDSTASTTQPSPQSP
jgi:VWFA-related protein